MKKSFVVLLGLLSAAALANNAGGEQQGNQPMLNLAVYDTSTQVAKPLGTQYSVSAKGIQLCWVAFNMPFSANNKVIEIFQSPDKATFSDTVGLVVSSEDKLWHKVSSSLSSQNNEFIQRCWAFDKNDPLGKYTLDIQINNVRFASQEFELVK